MEEVPAAPREVGLERGGRVLAVADRGVPDVRGVRADLVPPAREDPDGHEAEGLRAARGVRQHSEPRAGRLAVPADGAGRGVRGAPADAGADLPARRRHQAAAEHDVVAGHLPGVELEQQVVVGCIRLGREDQARARHVQAVQETEVAARVAHDRPEPRRQLRLHKPGERAERGGHGVRRVVLLVHLPPGGLQQDVPVVEVQHSPGGVIARGCRGQARARTVARGAVARARAQAQAQAQGSHALSLPGPGLKRALAAVEGLAGSHEPPPRQREQLRRQEAGEVERPDHGRDALGRAGQLGAPELLGPQAFESRGGLPGDHLEGALLALAQPERREHPRDVGQVLELEALRPLDDLVRDAVQELRAVLAERREGPGYVGQALRREAAELRKRLVRDLLLNL